MRPFIDLDRSRDQRKARPARPGGAARRPRPRRRLALAASTIVLLTACGADGDDEADPGADEIGADEDDAVDADASEPEDDDGIDDGDDGAGDGDAGDADAEGADAEGDDAAAVEPLEGEPSADEQERDAEGTGLTVTDVTAASHDEVDRVVLEVEGDGAPGFHARYAPDGEATSQGSGEPIEVEGDEAIELAVTSVALPPEREEGVEGWDGSPLPGPEGGIVLEVVEDTVFEGHHTFAIGVEEEHPFVVEVLEDPYRVVVDVHTDG